MTRQSCPAPSSATTTAKRPSQPSKQRLPVDRDFHGVGHGGVFDGGLAVFAVVMPAIPDVVQVSFRGENLADIVRHHDTARPDKVALLDQLQVALVQILPVIQEYQVKTPLQR